MSSHPSTAPPDDSTGRWRLRHILISVTALLAVVLVAAVVIGGWALSREASNRNDVVNHLDPARADMQRLSSAINDQDSAIRRYVVTRDRESLVPYSQAATDADQASTALRGQLDRAADTRDLVSRLDQVTRVENSWRDTYVSAVKDDVAHQRFGSDQQADVSTGRALIRRTKAQAHKLSRAIRQRRSDAQSRLSLASHALYAVLGSLVVVVVLCLIAVVLVLRHWVVRPITRLGEQVRAVTRGDYSSTVSGAGPREVYELGHDVELMRRQIVAELASTRSAREQLTQQAAELRRSNAELEQFAYVASHDLQEPLRKVASFSRLLQRRYADSLDERANRYIDLAVEGTERMQALIAGLLAFSRVGRLGSRRADVDLGESLDQARSSLSVPIEETGARIEAGPLPTVTGDPVLLRQLLQNLVSNAIKFHGDRPPVVEVTARRRGEEWEFRCADNGIGVSAENAERIFVIFQRLHTPEAYAGTGIGLALCRKIVEFHGGRIWLDTGEDDGDGHRDDDAGLGGTTIRWTLPVREAGAPAAADGDEG